MKNFIDTLIGSPLCRNMSKDEIHGLYECLKGHQKVFKKNTYIALEGEPLYAFGLLLEGEALLLREAGSGQRSIVSLLAPGDLFGEAAIFGSDRTWPLTIQAKTNCTVLFISADFMLCSCSGTCPGQDRLQRNMLTILADKNRTLNQKLLYLSLKNLESKIAYYLLAQCQKKQSLQITIPHNREELAAFFNVTRPALSRELARLHEQGLFQYQRSAFTITDVEKLECLAYE